MALFRTVSDKEATGKVREVFDDIKAVKGIDFVPGFWQALAINPDHLEATSADTPHCVRVPGFETKRKIQMTKIDKNSKQGEIVVVCFYFGHLDSENSDLFRILIFEIRVFAFTSVIWIFKI